MPNCFVSESPEKEEFWVDPVIDHIQEFTSMYVWGDVDDQRKSSSYSKIASSSSSKSISIPDIDSNTEISDLFSGKYLPKGVKSSEWSQMQSEQKKSKTMTTSVRYNRHLHTVKVPTDCPLNPFFISKLFNPIFFSIYQLLTIRTSVI